MDTGEWVTFDIPNGRLRGYLVKPSAPPPWPALLIIHPVNGVTEHVREVVQAYGDDGYLTLAPDLYTNDAQYPQHEAQDINEAAHMGPNSAGWDAHLAQFAEPQRSRVLAARQWMSNRPAGGYTDEVRSAFDYLKAHPDAGPVGSVGYCMGGRLTATLAAQGVDLAAGVIYYGGSPKAGDIPNIRCPMEGHYALTDTGITGKAYEFAQAMKAAGRHFAYCVYDADHGFNDPTTHAWNAKAAQQARERTTAFLRERLAVRSMA